MKIYKSNGGPNSIWNYEGNSIDFGGGTDLRVFHEFFHKQNYTNQSTNDYNYDALTFVTIDVPRTQVKFYRIGANINASGQIANAFVWDYAEKAMVCDW